MPEVATAVAEGRPGRAVPARNVAELGIETEGAGGEDRPAQDFDRGQGRRSFEEGEVRAERTPLGPIHRAIELTVTSSTLGKSTSASIRRRSRRRWRRSSRLRTRRLNNWWDGRGLRVGTSQSHAGRSQAALRAWMVGQPVDLTRKDRTASVGE